MCPVDSAPEVGVLEPVPVAPRDDRARDSHSGASSLSNALENSLALPLQEATT